MMFTETKQNKWWLYKNHERKWFDIDHHQFVIDSFIDFLNVLFVFWMFNSDLLFFGQKNKANRKLQNSWFNETFKISLIRKKRPPDNDIDEHWLIENNMEIQLVFSNLIFLVFAKSLLCLFIYWYITLRINRIKHFACFNMNTKKKEIPWW